VSIDYTQAWHGERDLKTRKRRHVKPRSFRRLIVLALAFCLSDSGWVQGATDAVALKSSGKQVREEPPRREREALELMDGRFVVQSDGTLRDTRRNITWAQSDNGSKINWTNAVAFCSQKGAGWGLPSMDELASLVDTEGPYAYATQCGISKCSVSPRFRLTGTWYWSNQTDGPSRARFMLLIDGDPSATGIGSSNFFRALCVRRS